MGNKLYVGNLPYSVTDASLQDLFAPHGSVRSAKVIMDRDSGRSKGFGFVEMGSDSEAQAAIGALNGKPVDGATADGLKVRVTAGQAAVIVHEPERGHTLRLKVGQRADILTGRIEEGYERREAAAAQAPLPNEPPAGTLQAQGAPAPEDAVQPHSSEVKGTSSQAWKEREESGEDSSEEMQ